MSDAAPSYAELTPEEAAALGTPPAAAPAPAAAAPTSAPLVVEDRSGKQWNIDPSQAGEYVRSGEYSLAPSQYQPGGVVPVSMGGKLQYVPSEEAERALRSFHADAAPREAVDAAEDRRYHESGLGKFRTAVGEFGNKASFGVTDWLAVNADDALARAGVEGAGHVAEDIRADRAANPGLAMGAGLAGMGVGAWLGGAVPGAVVGRAAGRGALALGATEGSLAARAVGAAATGAVDVGLMDAGAELSRQAIAREGLDGEKIAAAFGHGALVGGVAGAALPLAGAGLRYAGEKVGALATGVAERVGASETAGRVGDWLGEQGARARTAVAEGLASPEAQKLGAERLMEAIGATPGAVRELSAGLRERVERMVLDELPAVTGKGAHTAAERVAEFGRFAEARAAKVDQVLAQLGEAGVKTDKVAAAIRSGGKSAISAAEALAVRAEAQLSGTPLAAELRNATDELVASKWLTTQAEKQASKAPAGLSVGDVAQVTGQALSGNVLGAAGTLAAAGAKRLGDTYGAETIARAILRPEQVAGMVQQVDARISSAVQSYLSPVAGAAGRAAAAVKPVAAGVGQKVATGASRYASRRAIEGAPPDRNSKPQNVPQASPRAPTPRTAPGAPSQAQRQAADLVAQLDRSRAEQQARYQELALAYPPLAGTLRSTAATSERAHAYLASLLPPKRSQGASLTPQLERPRPTKMEAAAVLEAARVIDDPLSVLDALADNTITRGQVQALKTVYPQLYQQVRTTVQTELSARSEPVPYRQALQLSTLLQVVGHPALSPEVRAAVQATYAQASPDAAAAQAPASGPARPIATARDWSLDKLDAA